MTSRLKPIPINDLNHGDVVWFVSRHPRSDGCCGTDNDRYWVILDVTQEDIDRGTDAKKPGLYAFGGMWNGTRKDSIRSYGKMIIPFWRGHRTEAVVVGKIEDFTTEGIQRLT